MPQAVSAGEGTRYRVAGFWRRGAAGLIDALLLVPLALLFGGAASAVTGAALPRLGELGFDYLVHLALDGGAAGIAALTMSAIVVFLYFLVFSATTGQTPGKRLLRIRLIDAYGEPPSVGRALLRAIGSVFSVAVFCLGWLWIAFSREKRGLHDLIAGTYVVVVESAAARTAPLGATSS